MPAPRVKLSSKKGVTGIEVDHPEPVVGEVLLMEALGTAEPDFTLVQAVAYDHSPSFQHLDAPGEVDNLVHRHVRGRFNRPDDAVPVDEEIDVRIALWIVGNARLQRGLTP